MKQHYQYSVAYVYMLKQWHLLFVMLNEKHDYFVMCQRMQDKLQNTGQLFETYPGGGGGGYSSRFWVGV